MKTLAAGVVILSMALVAMAAAQTWPAKPVTIIVGTTAGSGMDSIARFVARELRERTGQHFVVENNPGAAGNIGAQAVARAAPDGYPCATLRANGISEGTDLPFCSFHHLKLATASARMAGESSSTG